MKVSERAVIQRIRRKLRHEGMLIRKTRSERWIRDLGDWYVMDGCNRFVGRLERQELEEYARELRVLAPYETIVLEQ